MTCIKSGARLLVDDLVYPCDLYQVGDCIIARTNEEGFPPDTIPPTHAFDFTQCILSRNSWFRKDLGVYVVTQDCLIEL